MGKKQRGFPVFSEAEVSALAKSMIFPEEGVGLYLDMLNQKVKEQTTKVSEVLKEARLAPMEIETKEEYSESTDNNFFEQTKEIVPEETFELQTELEPVFESVIEDESIEVPQSLSEELESRGLSDLSQEIIINNKGNFIANYDFLKNEGIDLDIKKLEKTFAPLALVDNVSLQQSYGTIIGNGYSIIKPNGNLCLNALLIEPTELEMKFESLRNVDAGDFFKLYPELITNDANAIANRINYCQTNNIEYKTNINGKDVYLPVILSQEEFESVGGAN